MPVLFARLPILNIDQWTVQESHDMQLAYTVQGSANEQKLLSIKYKIKTVDLDSRMLHFDMQGMEVDPKHKRHLRHSVIAVAKVANIDPGL
jgi:hypothetical protein